MHIEQVNEAQCKVETVNADGTVSEQTVTITQEEIARSRKEMDADDWNIDETIKDVEGLLLWLRDYGKEVLGGLTEYDDVDDMDSSLQDWINDMLPKLDGTLRHMLDRTQSRLAAILEGEEK